MVDRRAGYESGRTVVSLLLTILVASTLFSACVSAPAAQAPPVDMSLRIGLMPAVDAAPVLLAEKKGYFRELGLSMNIEVYNNAMNRQSALQSGQLDGTITDLVAFIDNVQNKLDIKITSSTDGTFPFLVRKGFREQKTISVGLMEVSVVNFLADASLGGKYTLEKVFINDIPARLEMVRQGKIDMAPIPEPMASMGEVSGLEKRLIKTGDDYVPDILVFTGKAIREKAKALELFHRAYNKAVDEIRRDPGQARDVLVSRLELDPRVRDLILLPEYHHVRLPSEAYVRKVTDWVEKVQKTKITVKYEDMIERKFAGD